jgi:hypothetical protein
MMRPPTVKRISLVLILIFAAATMLGLDIFSGGLITDSLKLDPFYYDDMPSF